MDNDLTYPLTFSGIRPGEELTVKELIADAGLAVPNLNSDLLTHFIVARKGDAIVGTVGLEPAGKIALLRSLAVAKDHRRQAVATRLVAAIEKYARSHGVSTLYLLTMDAADFFLRRSFRRVDRESVPEGMKATEEFRLLCADTAQCLCKHL
ncbi:MAG: GNAT family N-acetyltransferase [Desulfobacterales bacterium]